MNPMLTEALASILRWAFTLVSGYLVTKGIWSEPDAKTYVAGAAMAVLALGWSLWQKYASRLKLMTALAMPKGTTEKHVEETVKMGDAPPPTLKKDEKPQLKSER